MAATVNLHRILRLRLRLRLRLSPIPIPIALTLALTLTLTLLLLLLLPRPPRRIPTQRAIHQTRRAPSPELIDGANGIDSRVQRAARIEVLLDGRQQILAALLDGRVGDPRVRQRLVRRHARPRVDGQAAADELARRERDPAPVLQRREGVVRDQDRLHFFQVGVPVEGRVAAEEEVGYYAYGPDVAGWGSLLDLVGGLIRGGGGDRREREGAGGKGW